MGNVGPGLIHVALSEEDGHLIDADQSRSPLVCGSAVAALMAVVPACRTPPTQIVLVVDTNLANADLDEVKITVGRCRLTRSTEHRHGRGAETDAGPSYDISLTDGAHRRFR